MHIAQMLAALDAEIDRLSRVRTLLSQASGDRPRRGRPPGSKNVQRLPEPGQKTVRKKRTLSAEGRKAISEAQRKRHAKTKAVKVKRIAPKVAPERRMKKATKKANNALSAKAEVAAAPAKAPE